MTFTLPRWLAHGALPSATAVVFLLALVFGGGTDQGFWSDALVQIASLFLLAIVFLSSNLGKVPRGAVIAICFLAALPLAQLVPLPPTLWTAFGGREDVVRILSAAGISLPWLPVSLFPNTTLRSLFSLLPAVSVFLAVLSLDHRWRRNLVLMMLGVVFLSVFLDLLQMMGGQFSPFRFYETTNTDRAVGFFANSNHNAAFLYGAIPFAVALGLGLRGHRALLVVLLLGMIAVGLAVAQSRAGLILAVLAGLSCVALAICNGTEIPRGRLVGAIIGGNAIAVLIAFQFGFVSFANRLASENFSEDIRWPVASITFKAAQANLPFGTGFGTFVPVFQTVEPPTLLFDRYVNRAHNDWLELGLEGGLLTIAGAAAFLAWFVRSSFRVWRGGRWETEYFSMDWARASSIVILLLILHSIVDYPLRTSALMVVFAFNCALLVSPERLPVPFEGGKTQHV